MFRAHFLLPLLLLSAGCGSNTNAAKDATPTTDSSSPDNTSPALDASDPTPLDQNGNPADSLDDKGPSPDSTPIDTLDVTPADTPLDSAPDVASDQSLPQDTLPLEDTAVGDTADTAGPDDTTADLGFLVPPLEEVPDALIGVWDLVGFIDSGNAIQEVPPGTQFNIFGVDGTVKFQCNQAAGMPYSIVEKWNMPTIQVTISPGSEVFWVITRLTESELWYVEGGDEFRHARRANCN